MLAVVMIQALVLLVLPAGAQGRPSRTTYKDVTIRNDGTLHSSPGYFPSLTATLAITAKVTRRELATLGQAYQRDTDTKVESLAQLLTGFGQFFTLDPDFGLGASPDRAPDEDVSIKDGTATYTLQLDAGYYAHPLRTGRWDLSQGGQMVHLRTTWDAVPPGATYTVTFASPDVPIAGLRPLPQSTADGTMTWQLRGPRKAGGIDVWVRPAESTQLLLQAQDDAGAMASSFIRLLTQLSIVPLVLLFVRRRRVREEQSAEHDRKAADEEGPAQGGEHKASSDPGVGALHALAILIGVGGLFATAADEVFLVQARPDVDLYVTQILDIVAGVLLAASMVSLAWVAWIAGKTPHGPDGGAGRSAQRRRFEAALVLGGSAVGCAGLAVVTAVDYQMYDGPVSVSGLWAGIGSAACVLAGTTIFLLPALRALTGDRGGARRWWTLGLGALLVSLASLQWLAWMRNFESVARLGFQPWDDYTGAAWLPIARNASFHFRDLVTSELVLLPLVLFPALIRFGAALPRRGVLRSGTLVSRLVVVIFAFYVCEPWGGVAGIDLPVAAATGGGLLWAWLRYSRPPAGVEEEFTESHRGSLQRVTEIAFLRDRQRDLYGRYRAGELAAESYFEDHETTRRRLRSLLSASARATPEALRASTRHLAPHLAFARGAGDVWRNGLRAMSLGAWLAVVPVSYLAWALLHRVGGQTGVHAELGLIDFVVSLAQEAVSWLALAFVFGAVYARLPGTVGVAKGLALAVIYGVAQLAPLVVPGNEIVYSPTFGTVEGVLFLCLLGVANDWATLSATGADWRHLLDFYQVRRLRFAVSYVSPILVALAILIGQIVSGHAGSGVSEFVQKAPTIVGAPSK